MNSLNHILHIIKSPSNTYKKLSETENTEINKTRADLIKKVLTKLKRIIDYTPKYNATKIEKKRKYNGSC